MADKKEAAQEEARKRILSFIVNELNAGTEDDAIIGKLVKSGIGKPIASKLVKSIHSDMAKIAEKEKLNKNSVMMAIIGGIMAAIIGGILWGVITLVTNHEIGFVAWGLGALAGFAVILFTGWKKGMPLQVIAVISSLLGIFIGKYISFFYTLRQVLASEYPELISSMTLLSTKSFSFFISEIGVVLSGFDILWVFLAVATAWAIPRARGLKN